MERQPIDPKCKGCNRVINIAGEERCEAYANPAIWWPRGGCPLASHVKREGEKQQGKRRVGQQKQTKK